MHDTQPNSPANNPAHPHSAPPILNYESPLAAESAPTPAIRWIESDDEVEILLPAPSQSQFRNSSLYDWSMRFAPIRTWPGLIHYGSILLIAAAFGLNVTGWLPPFAFWLTYLLLIVFGISSSWRLSRYLKGQACLRLDDSTLKYQLLGHRAGRQWQWDRTAIAAVETRREPWWYNTDRPAYLCLMMNDGNQIRLPGINSNPDTIWIAQMLTRRLQGINVEPQ